MLRPNYYASFRKPPITAPSFRGGLLWILPLLLAPTTQAADFVMDPQNSRVEVAVKATGDPFVGHLDSFQTHILLEEASLTPQKAVMQWDFKDLKTGKEKRDKAMLKWLDHTAIPQAAFTMKTCESRQGTNWVTGEMNLHGVKKDISFPVQIDRQEQTVRIWGEATMDHRDFNLKVITMMLFFKVDPNLRISFALQGRLGGDKPPSDGHPVESQAR